MKIRVREKIFGCGLLAISVFFLLFDHLYLIPKKESALQKIEQTVQDSNTTDSKTKTSDPKLVILDEYDEAKTALMSYSLVGLALAYGYAFLLSKKIKS